MKKAISLILASLILFTSLSFTSLASNFSPTQTQMREYLATIGTPEDVINQWDDRTIELMYSKLYGRNVAFDSIQTTYYNENSDISVCDTIDSNDFYISMAFYNEFQSVAPGMLKVVSVDIYTVYNWKNLPLHYTTDAMAINWDSSLFAYKEDSFYVEFDHTIDNCHTQYGSSSTLSALDQGGLGFEIDLSSGFDWKLNGLSGCASFSLLPKSTIYGEGCTENTSVTTISANYTHVNEMFNFDGFKFSISIGGVIGIEYDGDNQTMASGMNYFYDLA